MIINQHLSRKYQHLDPCLALASAPTHLRSHLLWGCSLGHSSKPWTACGTESQWWSIVYHLWIKSAFLKDRLTIRIINIRKTREITSPYACHYNSSLCYSNKLLHCILVSASPNNRKGTIKNKSSIKSKKFFRQPSALACGRWGRLDPSVAPSTNSVPGSKHLFIINIYVIWFKSCSYLLRVLLSKTNIWCDTLRKFELLMTISVVCYDRKVANWIFTT